MFGTATRSAREHSCRQKAPKGNSLRPVSEPLELLRVAADRNVRAPEVARLFGRLEIAERVPYLRRTLVVLAVDSVAQGPL